MLKGIAQTRQVVRVQNAVANPRQRCHRVFEGFGAQQIHRDGGARVGCFGAQQRGLMTMALGGREQRNSAAASSTATMARNHILGGIHHHQQQQQQQQRCFWKWLFSSIGTSTVAAAQGGNSSILKTAQSSEPETASTIDSPLSAPSFHDSAPAPTTNQTMTTMMMENQHHHHHQHVLNQVGTPVSGSSFVFDPSSSSSGIDIGSLSGIGGEVSMATVEFRPEAVAGFDVTFLPADHSLLAEDETSGIMFEIEEFFSGIFSSIHEITGLPYWATISVVCVLVRCCLLPLAAISYRTSLKLMAVKAQTETIKNRTKAIGLNQGKYSSDATAHYSAEMNSLFRQQGIQSSTQFLSGLAQVPVFVFLWLTIRHMAMYHSEQLSIGGMAWFTNLCVPDPFYILPVISTIVMWTNFETNFFFQARDAAGQPMKSMQRKAQTLMKVVFRGFCLVLPFFISSMQAAIIVYWITNGLFTTLQALLFRTDAFRKLFKIPLVSQLNAESAKQAAISTALFSQAHVAPTLSKPLASEPLQLKKSIHVTSSRRT